MLKDLERIITSKMKDYKLRTVEKITKLDALSPLKTLSRGYSIIEKDNKLIKSVNDLKIDDVVNLKLTDGNVNARVI